MIETPDGDIDDLGDNLCHVVDAGNAYTGRRAHALIFSGSQRKQVCGDAGFTLLPTLDAAEMNLALMSALKKLDLVVLKTSSPAAAGPAWLLGGNCW